MARAGYGDLEVGAETSSVQAVHPVGTEAAPGIAFSTDTDVGLYRAGANQLGISVSGTGQVVIIDGVLQPVTTNDIDLGTASLQFKNAWFDGVLEADAITVGGVSVATGTNATTVTTTANNANETVYPTFVDGTSSSQDIEVDTGLTYNPSTGVLTTTSVTGNLTGNVTGNTSGSAGSATGNAATATALATARNIGGVSFDGTGNIDLPGVNTAGNQATSGLAATATLAATTTALASARTIGGVSFDGTGNINLPGVNTAGNQATSGLAATSTLAAASTAATVTVNDATAENNLIPFVADAASSTGNHGLEMDTDFHYNPNTGVLTVGSITGGVTGSATQITVTAVTDDDTVYPVFATATSGANTPEVASGLTYNPSTGALTATSFTGAVSGTTKGSAFFMS